MSWSRSWTGTPGECLGKARDERESIEASLPEFERPQVGHVIGAGGALLESLPTDAKITLSLNGHGSRNSDGSGSGAMGVSVNYSIAAGPTT